jgi:hypothetical protein
MTNKAAPKEPKGGPDLARFLQDWTAMWQEELRAQASDPTSMAGAMEMWRAAMTVWSAVPTPLATAAARPAHDRVGAPRAQAADAASVAVHAEVERLNRRVDELESRLAQLELPRPRSPNSRRSSRRGTS